ncbi:MAG TPA: hypothetical protein EYP54_03995, partial [Anaerolineales bacterium]|nr:hypothetical protein [Anaerolineales bacterium]
SIIYTSGTTGRPKGVMLSLPVSWKSPQVRLARASTSCCLLMRWGGCAKRNTGLWSTP